MARFKLTVEMQDGSVETVAIGDADSIAAESKYDIDATAFTAKPKTEWWAYMAWNAMKRRKQTALGWDAFKEQVESIDPVIEGDTDSGN